MRPAAPAAADRAQRGGQAVTAERTLHTALANLGGEMSLFRRRASAEPADPVQIGLAHLLRCVGLCRNINPFIDAALNTPIEAAIAAFPVSALPEIDAERSSARELVSAWMKIGGDGPSKTTIYERYVYAYSLLRAALRAKSTGYVAPMAAHDAVGELQALAMGAIREGATDFAEFTGGRQLEQLGSMFGDYSVLVSAAAIQLLGSHHAKPANGIREELRHVTRLRRAQQILGYLPEARRQKANDHGAMKILAQWEELARRTLQRE